MPTSPDEASTVRPTTGMDDARAIVAEVTAPGDLPRHDLEARLATQAWQFRHDNIIVPHAPRPGEAVDVYATSGGAMPLARACAFYTSDGRTPTLASTKIPLAPCAVEWDVLAGYLTRWRAALPPQGAGTVVRYRIAGWHTEGGTEGGEDPDVWAHDGQGFWFRYPGERGVTTFAYRVEPRGPVLPEWTRDAIIYHIFLDRFHPGTADGAFRAGTTHIDRHGGTLRGVRQALPYLADLGVTCLWLSPLACAETYHRYDATDLYAVDPDLGTAEDLRGLIDDAHGRGLRVLLDFVPSHCSWHHPAFTAAQQDAAAPTAGWFTFEEWPHRYRNFMNLVPSLPSFNTDDPTARAHIIDSAVRWLRDYGVDGFRLDHASGLSMDFWVAFRDATRAVAPDVVTIGEVTDTPDALRRFRGRLDSILDFRLALALRSTFGTDHWDVGRLDAFLTAHERYLATGPGQVSFLDNHDMNRFLFVAGGRVARLKLAALCQFTLAAVPTIYYGTEIGLSQRDDVSEGYGGDAEARRDMPWDTRLWDRDLLTFYRALIRLRRDRIAVRRGERRTIHLDVAAGTYAYTRALTAANGGPSDVILVVFNLGETAHTMALTLPGHGAYTCLLSVGIPPLIRREGDRTVVTLEPGTGTVVGQGPSLGALSV